MQAPVGALPPNLLPDLHGRSRNHRLFTACRAGDYPHRADKPQASKFAQTPVNQSARLTSLETSPRPGGARPDLTPSTGLWEEAEARATLREGRAMDGYTVGQMHHPLGQWSRLSVILGHLANLLTEGTSLNKPEREVLDESVGAFVVLTRPNHSLHSEPPQNLGNPGRDCGGKAGTTLPSRHFLDSHEQLAEGQPLRVPVLIPSLVTHLRWLPDWRKTGEKPPCGLMAPLETGRRKGGGRTKQRGQQEVTGGKTRQ